MDAHAWANALDGTCTPGGLRLRAHADTADAATVAVADREELPISMTVDDERIVCVTRICAAAEVPASERGALHVAMLEAGPAMALSAFGILNGDYIVYGELEAGSQPGAMRAEIEALSDNALAGLELLAPLTAEGRNAR